MFFCGTHLAQTRFSRPGRLARAVLILAATALLSGCAIFSSAPPDQGLGDSLGGRIAATARSQIGARYRYGGDTPSQGFDCSGLVQWAFAQNRVRVPRTVDEQASAGSFVRPSDIAPGDMVFFNTSFKRPSLHVGIATARGLFVHSPSSGGKVREDRLSDPYWTSVYVATRRVVP
ncbi:C40 family peptidase [Desulfolutivibrio sulfoxidireducens]|uniref:C40 family peptidase n=1 Tax=Desulfolutivibrio sulfoxidireducens TaxID=2773299 RepID=UPI00159E003B|nr:C40 family peptidase [Desulfolutivibrio sulfoxidireducens]